MVNECGCFKLAIPDTDLDLLYLLSVITITTRFLHFICVCIASTRFICSAYLCSQVGLFIPVESTHTYKVKIINPLKKNDSVLRHLRFNSRFDPLLVFCNCAKLIEAFHDCAPNTVVFNVAIDYFEGQQHSNISMITAEDLCTVYSR